jgi:nucleoside-diphosphate-sugar epimerase
MSRLHVIVGGGPLGRAVASELVERGEQVRLLSRHGDAAVAGAESVAADATVPADLDRAFVGASVVYQCSQPEYTRWAQEFPQLQRGILNAAVRAGADLVIADNLYLYGDGDGATITEKSPSHPLSRKGAVRQAMAEEALAAHDAGRLRVALSRPANYYGPGHDQSSKAVFSAALSGKPMQFLGRTDQLTTFSYFPDAAAAMATLGTSDAGWGKAWIAPVQPPITQGEFAARVWSAAGQSGKPRIAALPKIAARVLGLFVPVIRELPEMYYQWDRPYLVDSSLIESTLGVYATPLDQAISATLDSYR